MKTKASKGVVTAGEKYEMVAVQTAAGAVQIYRPALKPNPKGPMMLAPKERYESVSGSEAGYYDTAADVLVFINPMKGVDAKGALDALVKK